MELHDTVEQSPRSPVKRRRQSDVLQEQIAILREISAPQDVIELAERVLREGLAARVKKPR